MRENISFYGLLSHGCGVRRFAALIAYLLVACISANVYAQKRPLYDSTYYVSYRQDVVGRIFFSEKYTDIDVKSLTSGERFSYHPNTNYVMGVGLTYKPLTINIGYGFGFLNTDKAKGKTRSIDVKSHIYSNKWIADLYAQYYKGFFAFPKEINLPAADNYYLRPDLKVLMFGASAYRVLNHRRFSYRPAFLQDTWQKKSAGSMMIGLAAFYTSFNGDSAFAPTAQHHRNVKRDISSAEIIQLGPGVGYAYHLVLPWNLFIMTSVNGNLNLNFVREGGGSATSNQLSVNPALLYRAAAGYTNGNWNVNLSVFNQQLPAKGASSGNKYITNTGNFRLNIAKRLVPGEKGKRLLLPISLLNASSER
jgi:hypothetical protein